ncbi:endonuclease MutS2 [Treponema sp. C6A8]|uniref:endonuclease MutS2 n=1 Tax=Treponema sp. C6A8 TaxID=1410609 RepID=UPI0004851D34|nr:Smr/MutS family protein [Treponema sp. C6A8]
MNEKTLTEIDYFRIRDEISLFCLSEEGKYDLQNREPFTESKKIEFYKNCSREWKDWLSAVKGSPFSAWGPVHGLTPIIKTNGASLTLEQVKALGEFCTAAENVKAAVLNHKEALNLKALTSQVELLPDISETSRKIFRIITKDGEMRELPEIAEIRSKIASLNSQIKNIMKKFTGDQKYAAVLESSVPVLRGGRQVLAVKANQQTRIKGIIHDVSASAQTVFIEPEEAVFCSNELIQKEYELQSVIKRILTELTADLQPSIPVIRDSLPLMKIFDTTLAAARWGMEHSCVYAQKCGKEIASGHTYHSGADSEPPLLLQARHPLLGEKCVPIDIRFMTGKRVLIITGPNTGGKTVTLKTFALLSMLNQSGFPVPAGEGTRLPVFSNVFADIGDDQSLDQSLSTFSGHMKNIAHAINAAREDTLILLDELGSGTDPQEGTAISMAVLDKLIEKGSFVLVTTHQGILKNYGYTNESCVNASVEFDTNTLSPSYRLLMGVPGESHALDIAQKSGLPREICRAARDYIATEQADVSALIRGLNQKHLELDKMQSAARREADLIEENNLKLREKEVELRRKEHELKSGKQQEMYDFLVHSRRQLENLVRQIKEGELTREKTLGVKGFISDLEKNVARLDKKIEAEGEELEKAAEELKKAKEKRKHPASNKTTKKKLSLAEALKTATSVTEDESAQGAAGGLGTGTKASAGKNTAAPSLVFEVGASVKSKNGGNSGIITGSAKKGVWQVQFGSIKMTMKEKDLQLVNAPQNLVPSYSVDMAPNVYEYGDNVIVEKEGTRPVYELRLLGMYAEEAVKALERQIDLCVLNNFDHFSVIHGKGNGVLQQAVRDYLSHSPAVADFEYAPAEDGGAGKTYVTLCK